MHPRLAAPMQGGDAGTAPVAYTAAVSRVMRVILDVAGKSERGCMRERRYDRGSCAHARANHSSLID